MSSRKGCSNPARADTSDPSYKGKTTADVSSRPGLDQLAHGVSDINIDSIKEDGWEVYGKKSKNKTGSNRSPKQSGAPHFGSKDWGHADTTQSVGMQSHGGSGRGSGQTWSTLASNSRKPTGREYTKPQSYYGRSDSNYVAAPVAIAPPLKNGWGWSSRTTSAQRSGDNLNLKDKAPRVEASLAAADDDDDDDAYDSDESDDELMGDEFDSDENQKSHETKKKNKWFKELFACLDGLTNEQIHDPKRQWHCPACKGGPGAIEWYRGLEPLVTHARNKRSKRVKLHAQLAEILDEELHMRGISAIPAGEIFGKWKGLEERADMEIVWPPMVMVTNTRHDMDDNEKWIGMGNQELMDYFSSYSAIKARHSYGPQGHRGISVLIFEASAVGYMEAERLSKHFEDTCRDRLAWDKFIMPFHPGGKRQLYGFMAEKQDLDNFNQHSQGKLKLKYEMRSYREMVVDQLKQMSKDNHQLLYFKHKVAKEKKTNKALEESFGVIADRLRKTVEENRIVKLKTKTHHEQNKEEMDFQEQFFKDQIQQFYDARNEKEEDFEKIQQHQREKLTQTEGDMSSSEESVWRAEKIASSIQLQDKEMEEFVHERDKLVRAHEQRMLDLKRRQFDEMAELEQLFDGEFNRLLDKYNPNKRN